MNPQTIIRNKRDGKPLSSTEVAEFVNGSVNGTWSSCQIGAMLMALMLRGMDLAETRALLDAMIASGERLDVSGLQIPTADKHSTGGVGDKVSLVLAPLAACCGLAVPMLSGRGLGHTGGTLDKLESIPGFNVFLSREEIKAQLNRVGCVIAGQTNDIVPADKVLYAMRDETATVENTSLIAASILSKKLVEGLDALLLDVKFGCGAFMQTPEQAETLARLMVDLGGAMGCRVSAWLSRMDTPLGRSVGNALEVEECIAILRNEGPDELTELIVEQVAGLLVLTGIFTDRNLARQEVLRQLESGSALVKFATMVAAQGGNPGIVEDPSLLPRARFVVDIHYEERVSVYVSDVNSRKIAEVVVDAGGGRRNAGDKIDHACGVNHLACVGDIVRPGEIIARLHHSSRENEQEWIERIRDAIKLVQHPITAPARIYKEIN